MQFTNTSTVRFVATAWEQYVRDSLSLESRWLSAFILRVNHTPVKKQYHGTDKSDFIHHRRKTSD